jgi:hypothetical protein
MTGCPFGSRPVIIVVRWVMRVNDEHLAPTGATRCESR